MALVLFHMLCSLFSYVAFLTACLAGALFLIQERQLKRKTMGLLFHRLPSLDGLDRVNCVAIGVGFALLTIGVACGVLGTKQLFGRWWRGDPKEYLTIVLWLAYLVLWVVRLRSTLRGHRVALLSVLGFCLLLFTVLGATWVAPSLHPYAYRLSGT